MSDEKVVYVQDRATSFKPFKNPRKALVLMRPHYSIIFKETSVHVEVGIYQLWKRRGPNFWLNNILQYILHFQKTTTYMSLCLQIYLDQHI